MPTQQDADRPQLALSGERAMGVTSYIPTPAVWEHWLTIWRAEGRGEARLRRRGDGTAAAFRVYKGWHRANLWRGAPLSRRVLALRYLFAFLHLDRHTIDFDQFWQPFEQPQSVLFLGLRVEVKRVAVEKDIGEVRTLIC